jgi:hypothetical protein
MNLHVSRTVAHAVAASGLTLCFLAATSTAAHAACSTEVSGISDPVVTEGNFNKSVTVHVTLDDPAIGGETVTLVTQNGSAQVFSDFNSKGQTLTFSKGNIYKTFTVTLLGGKVPEPQEHFYVVILATEGLCGITANPPFSDITVNDND